MHVNPRLNFYMEYEVREELVRSFQKGKCLSPFEIEEDGIE